MIEHRCTCDDCARLHDRYHPDPRIHDCVAELMMNMTPNPFDREGKPCPSIRDIVDVVAVTYGKRAAAMVCIEIH
jgi:hypothetical protein